MILKYDARASMFELNLKMSSVYKWSVLGESGLVVVYQTITKLAVIFS